MIVARRRPEDFSPTVQRLLAVGTAWHMEQHGDEFGAFLEWWLSTGRGVRSVLEIGVRQGGTAAVWCSLSPRYHVVGVDLPAEQPVLKRLSTLFPYFRGIAGDSHDPAIKDQIYRSMYRYKLLFLDGDHSLTGVQQDFADYSPLVEPGGLVVCHDIVDTPHMRAAGHGVCDFWAALTGEKTEFLLGDGEWGGIGCWRKP